MMMVGKGRIQQKVIIVAGNGTQRPVHMVLFRNADWNDTSTHKSDVEPPRFKSRGSTTTDCKDLADESKASTALGVEPPLFK